jgi:hypothetical protein
MGRLVSMARDRTETGTAKASAIVPAVPGSGTQTGLQHTYRPLVGVAYSARPMRNPARWSIPSNIQPKVLCSSRTCISKSERAQPSPVALHTRSIQSSIRDAYSVDANEKMTSRKMNVPPGNFARLDLRVSEKRCASSTACGELPNADVPVNEFI